MTGTEHIAGRWAVRAELGRGSMGRVLLVEEAPRAHAAGAVPAGRPARQLACKVLERAPLQDDFVNEIKLLRRLAHPGFAHVVELLALPVALTAGAPRPQLVALMERATGQPLAPGQVAAAEVWAIAWALLEALDHLHRSGIVHGDLAPDNVLWDSARRRLTVLDLGAGGERGARAGRTSGVLAYAAPERLEGAGLEPAGDLWSAGALLFGVVHGRHPWPGYPATRGAKPLLDGLAPHALDPMILRLLSVDPAARHPSATAALAELAAARPELAQGGAAAVEPAFVDAGQRIAHAAEELVRAARAGRATSLDLRGALGSGRSRALVELRERLAVAGVPGVPIAIRDDDEHAFLGDALAALGHERQEPSLGALVRAVGQSGGPLALAVDDLERAPAVRRMLERLARSLETIPEHYRGLILLTVGLGVGPSLEMARWGGEDVATTLALRFPGRRVQAGDAAALADAARGQAGLVRTLIEAARDSGVMRVDHSQVICDVERLGALVPPSLEAGAEGALAARSVEARRTAAVIAWAERAVPMGGAAVAELVEHGLAVHETRGVRLMSEALARAARGGLTAEEARRDLAACYEAAGERALALGERLRLGEEVVADAEAALLAPGCAREAGIGLLRALVAREAWPARAEVARRVGELAEGWGQAREAAVAFRRAEALARASEEEAEIARAWLGIGRLEAAGARYAQALEAYRQAEPWVDGDVSLTVALLSGQARAAVLSGELELAEAVSERGIALAETPLERASLLYSRGLSAWYQGRLDEAEARLEAALTTLRESGEASASARKEEAAIVTAQGLVAHRRGELARAALAYGEAMKLGEAARDEARVLTALQNLGVVQHERGEWTEALDTYREAMARAEQLDARARIAQIAGNLGNLWRYLGETERAQIVLERGLEIARADGNRHLAAVIVNLLGDVASDRGELAQAEARFREAVAIADEARCEPEALEATLNLGRLALERFELATARQCAERAAAMAEARQARAMRVGALALEAGIRRVGHDGGDGRSGLAAARAAIEQAIAEVEVVKNPDGRWPIYLEAALCARDREDVAAAQGFAREVRKVLQAQLDSVPAAFREAFMARRDRRAAYRETAALSAEAREASAGQGLGWGRLLEVHKRLAGEHNVQRLLEYIMDSAILLTGAERGFLLLDDESHREGLEVRVARNLDQENIRNKHLKISRGIARRVIQAGEPIVTVDAMEDERYREQLSVVDLRLRSIMCLPMAFRGRVLGAIYLDNRFRASAFAGEDMRFMEAFCDMAAVALDNARLVESLEAQKRATDAARREVESLNQRLAQELERRTRELEDTKVQMIAERRQLASEHRFENIIGSAPAMRKLFQMIDRLKSADVAVLIEGESGTGKELVARAIHFAGQRRERPFVAVNCGAIPATLLESELFGHVRGAFTNATSDKKGLFEVAHTGTLFLDEIGEMPLEMQVKLLRVLQSGEIQKVGATRQVVVDVRIVAATNRKLEEEVQAGRFREDLFYRLSVIPLVVPPLRERREDIPLLVQHFIEANRKAGLGEVGGISKEALALLSRYPWPGNVRQLETVLKNASVFCDGPTLTPRDFESFPDIVAPGGSAGLGALSDKGLLALGGRTLAELERLAIVQALKDNKGNKKRTAELLGIDRRTLYNKLAAYEIAIESDLKVS